MTMNIRKTENNNNKNKCDENQVSVKQSHSNQYDAFKSIILV